ncbi:hypothetical protein [Roseomonas sp. BN140053]|uniref:hypothetical protein n=1 Tax=Roseomonas sp. BN140053 TaxID=3391898 RepID=UPI0039E7AE30
MSGAAVKRDGSSKPARRVSSPPPRPAGGSKNKNAGRSQPGAPRRPWWRRPVSVTAILLALFIGLPLAQALLGDLGAIMLGCLLAGFALGRATA